MSERSYLDFIEDILRSIETIEDYVSDLSYEEFQDERRTVDAVVRNFEVIGEAASNLSEEIKEQYDFVEWRGVNNFRNVMIHDYFQVDTHRVWDTINNNLPELKDQVRRILEEEID